ncbi:hypothetical protein [Corynebacterium sp. AOP12-C2-36]|uniref:hypothetical protein n=1 Tax=Corynebacterium sp. AOP12-C2-36 TaxID=3457723 RepID=UPI004034EFA5
MPPKKKNKFAPASVFDATVMINFQSIDPTFMAHLRRVVIYTRTHGRPPGVTYRSRDGLNSGAWLQQCQAAPHALSIEQRALLLSVPGVRLSLDPSLCRLPMGYRSDSEEKLWRRVSAWADNPVYDAGTRRARYNAMRLRIQAAAARDETSAA